MGININDLNDNLNLNSSSSLSDNQKGASNLHELSDQELKISGGGINPGIRTVIVADDDIDVYIIDDFFTPNVVYNPNPVNIKPGGKINFNNGNVVMDENGDINVTFSDSESSSSSD